MAIGRTLLIRLRGEICSAGGAAGPGRGAVMLDERTVVVMMAMTHALLALVAVSLRAGHREDVRGIGLWALTLAGNAIGLLLVAYAIALPWGPPQLLPNLFFLPSAALLGVSLQRFFGGSPSWSRWVIATGLAYVLGGLLSVRPEHGPWRVTVFVVLYGASIGLGLRAVLRGAELRRGLGGRVVLAGLLALAAAVAVRVSLLLGGGVAILMSGAAEGLLSLYLIGTHSGLTLITLGVIQLAAERMRRRLEGLANLDALTGVLTRRGFTALAGPAVASARREKPSVGFVVGDVDWFKAVNDRHGHQAGDAVLAMVGRVLQAQSRPGDLVARFGGEEFAVLLPNADLADAQQAAERVRRSIEAETVRLDGHELRVTMSLGAAALPADSASVDALYCLADAALLRAKAAGRNRVEAAQAASAAAA